MLSGAAHARESYWEVTMARRYNRDKIGRFASKGGGGGRATGSAAGAASQKVSETARTARERGRTARNIGKFAKAETSASGRAELFSAARGSQRQSNLARMENKAAQRTRRSASRRAASAATGRASTATVPRAQPARRRRSMNEGVRGESKATKMERAVRIAEKRVRRSLGKPSFERNMRRYSRAQEVQTRNFGARLSGI